MFRLLSKESNIFSIPVYIGFLLLIIIAFNAMDINRLDAISAVITFAGISLGYFLFNKLDLTYQTHLPLFLYTFYVFAFYPGDLSIGLAITLLINSFLLLILTSTSDKLRKGSYLLVGALLCINYLFLPIFWPLIFFVIIHIFVTSGKALANLFRLFFGALLILIIYFSVMYWMDYESWDNKYWPLSANFKMVNEFSNLYFITPIILMIIYAVLDHFRHFNEKSPTSKYKYTFLLLFSSAFLISIILYMGTYYEMLLVLGLPVSIILSRMLKFFPKYWMQELGLWTIIMSLFLFKIAPYIFQI
ncbi:hypothetical protein G6R40_07425 [Chryseobacterium sp. POL2]|uniref:DUF6427 family protein n=1 Tax=Chryseobacterium sp. POL2 TaxID=2713414 RepID=UPI0013E20711|nr:DUF6427 family protein [Chryseobacterium sp. POL2]QIG89505.1 hypothetical protein G6R40_07425 [Chryseobacterium sp. POL2]